MIPKKVAGGVGLADLVGAGLVAYFSEPLIRPVVGDNTIISGAVKIGGGLLSRKFLGSGFMADSVSLGLSVAGMEDILNAILGEGRGLGALGGIFGGAGAGGAGGARARADW